MRSFLKSKKNEYIEIRRITRNIKNWAESGKYERISIK